MLACTMINILLAAHLLAVFPALNLWRSLRPKKDKPPLTPLRRYWSMSWQPSACLLVLWAGCRQAGYTLSDIGFDLPLSTAGAWGLCVAALLFGGMWVGGSIAERRKTPQARAENERKLLESPFPWPRSGGETVAFVASTSLMTAAWEILYRGFILLLLAPATGLPLAIAISALAYGVGHGYTNPKQLVGSVVAAFVFTIAYAMTHSLWWLIVIHAGLPLSMLPAALRAQRRQAAGSAETSTLAVPQEHAGP